MVIFYKKEKELLKISEECVVVVRYPSNIKLLVLIFGVVNLVTLFRSYFMHDLKQCKIVETT